MISKIVLIGLGLVLIAKSQGNSGAKTRPSVANDLRNPSDWMIDMTQRLNGTDLSLDGNHPAPSGYDAYGMGGEMALSRTPGFYDNIMYRNNVSSLPN